MPLRARPEELRKRKAHSTAMVSRRVHLELLIRKASAALQQDKHSNQQHRQKISPPDSVEGFTPRRHCRGLINRIRQAIRSSTRYISLEERTTWKNGSQSKDACRDSSLMALWSYNVKRCLLVRSPRTTRADCVFVPWVQDGR